MNFCFLLFFVSCHLGKLLAVFTPDESRSPSGLHNLDTLQPGSPESAAQQGFRLSAQGAPILPRALSAATGRLILCGAACFSPSGCFVASVSWTLSEVQCLGFCCRDGKKPGDFTPSDLEESHIFRSSLSEFCWASVLSSLYCLRNVIIIFLTFHLSFILSFNYSNTY